MMGTRRGNRPGGVRRRMREDALLACAGQERPQQVAAVGGGVPHHPPAPRRLLHNTLHSPERGLRCPARPWAAAREHDKLPHRHQPPRPFQVQLRSRPPSPSRLPPLPQPTQSPAAPALATCRAVSPIPHHRQPRPSPEHRGPPPTPLGWLTAALSPNCARSSWPERSALPNAASCCWNWGLWASATSASVVLRGGRGVGGGRHHEARGWGRGWVLPAAHMPWELRTTWQSPLAALEASGCRLRATQQQRAHPPPHTHTQARTCAPLAGVGPGGSAWRGP